MPAYTAKLDPTAEASGTELDISDSTAGYFLTAVETPAPDLNPLYATSIDVEGSVPVAEHYENRVVTIGLRVIGTSAANLQTRLAAISKKIGKLAREQGTLKVTYPTSDPVTFDVTSATIAGLPTDDSYQTNHRAELTLRFECRPFGRGPVTTYADAVETTNPCLIITAASVPGDALALGKLVIDEDQAQDQFFVMHGVQSRYYDSATSAGLFWQAESLTPKGASAATAVGPSGASGGGSNTILASALQTSTQAILSTQATGGGAHMSHVGDFRVWARVQCPTTTAGTVSLSLEWAPGDYASATVNDAVTISRSTMSGWGEWRLVDLGLVHLAKVTQGTQQWEGRLLASSTSAGDGVYVDCLFLMPCSEGYAETRGNISVTTPTSLSALDTFAQTAGALAAKTLNVGGTWSGAGSATDFAVTGSGTVTRTTTADADSTTSGRFALAGTTTLTDTFVEADVSASAHPAGSAVVRLGAIARYVDTSNWLRASYVPGTGTAGGLTSSLVVEKRVAGTVTPLDFKYFADAAGTQYKLRLVVSAAGRWYVWLLDSAGDHVAILTGKDSVLATAGTLASGKFGLYDSWAQAASTRTYDNFLAGVAPMLPPAIYASQSLEIRHDRTIREDAGGTIWSAASSHRGSRLYILPAGQEGRTTRILVKASRRDPDWGGDPGVDDISAVLSVTPRYLNIPSI